MRKIKKKIYKEPIVEKVEHVDFPGVDEEDDTDAKYMCSGANWNSGTSRKCLDGMEEK